MTTLTQLRPTLADVAKRLDPNGKVDTIVEMLNQTNEVLDQMVWMEGNLVTGHRSTVRTGLPQPTWRMLYGGVQPGKSKTAQITDTCGMLEAYAEIDKALADLNGNTAEFRMSEDMAFIEGMNQEFASTLWYGNEDDAPAEFTGLSPRFNSLSAENGENIIVGGGSDDGGSASIWLVVWGPNSCHGIYPKGSVAGLKMEDKGQVTIEDIDGSGGRMEGYRTHYRWDLGLTVRDWRQIIRIPNIDVSALAPDLTTGANIPDLMTQALEKVHSLNMGRPSFYMNRTLRTMLRRQSIEYVKNSTLAMDEIAGRKVTTFGGVPVYVSDSLLSTEGVVS